MNMIKVEINMTMNGILLIKELSENESGSNVKIVEKGQGFILNHGQKIWYENGLVHRDNDLPAIEGKNLQLWYKNGQLHRDNDLPAVITVEEKIWYQYSKKHRILGPAHELSDGSKYWYQFDWYHSSNGPAIERADGTKEWWLNGQKYSEEDYLKKK